MVDKDNPLASDGNLGTEDDPWSTLQHAAATLVPGDTVFVLPTSENGYVEGTITPLNSGTPNQPISYIARPDGNGILGAVVIRGGNPAVNLRDKDYIRFEGFEIKLTEKLGSSLDFIHLV